MRAQIYPHKSFTDEVDFLDTMFTGSAYVHGPLNSDHWYTYVADDNKRPTIATADRTLNVMMYELEPKVAHHFFKSEEASRRGFLVPPVQLYLCYRVCATVLALQHAS